MGYKVCKYLQPGPYQTDDGRYICTLQKNEYGPVYVPKSKCMDSDAIEQCQYYIDNEKNI